MTALIYGFWFYIGRETQIKAISALSVIYGMIDIVFQIYATYDTYLPLAGTGVKIFAVINFISVFIAVNNKRIKEHKNELR